MCGIIIIIIITCICVIFGIINDYHDNHYFTVPKGCIGYLVDNKTNKLSTEILYHYKMGEYKKNSNEYLKFLPIENNKDCYCDCVTSDDKMIQICARYHYVFDLSNLCKMLCEISTDRDVIFDKLSSYIRDMIKFNILQYRRKELFDYTITDKCLSDINNKLSVYLLNKGIFIDIKVTDMLITKTLITKG